jgi:uncharacterized protein YndB with AHSA1/START domain
LRPAAFARIFSVSVIPISQSLFKREPILDIFSIAKSSACFKGKASLFAFWGLYSYFMIHGVISAPGMDSSGDEMGRVVVTEVLPAAPSAVWEVVSDPRRAAEWAEGEGFVRHQSGREAGPGSEWVLRIRFAGIPFLVRGRRLDWQPSERAMTLLEGPFGLRIVDTFKLEPHVLGTEWTWVRDYALPGGALGDWLDRRWVEGLLARRARGSVANLVRLFRPEGVSQLPKTALSVFTEKPVDRPWGLDSASRAPRGTQPAAEGRAFGPGKGGVSRGP